MCVHSTCLVDRDVFVTTTQTVHRCLLPSAQSSSSAALQRLGLQPLLFAPAAGGASSCSCSCSISWRSCWFSCCSCSVCKRLAATSAHTVPSSSCRSCCRAAASRRRCADASTGLRPHRPFSCSDTVPCGQQARNNRQQRYAQHRSKGGSQCSGGAAACCSITSNGMASRACAKRSTAASGMPCLGPCLVVTHPIGATLSAAWAAQCDAVHMQVHANTCGKAVCIHA